MKDKKKLIERIQRILEDLIEFNHVDIFKYLADFQVSESTLKRDFEKVAQYIAHEDLVKSDYGINKDSKLNQYISDTQRVAFIIANDDNPSNQAYLENLFSQINKLPKRNDLKYKEIENFKDYELTYCIVNEMAIRNKRAAKLIKVFHILASYQDRKSTKYNQYKQIIKYNLELSGELKSKYKSYIEICNKDSKKNTIYKIYQILKHTYMVSPLDCKLDGVNYIPGRTTYTTLQKFDNEDFKSMINGELRLNTNQFDFVTQTSLNGSHTYGRKPYDGFILEQKKYNHEDEFKYSVIEPVFERKIKDNNVTTLSINFSLPKDEIMAYISHIVDTLHPSNADKKIKTPEEITTDEFYTHSFTKLNISQIANYFFIYDYVTKRRDDLKKEYLKYKEDQIEYNEDIEMQLVKKVFKEKHLHKQTKLDESAIKRYYYVMFHFIEKLEYRELINSAFYKPKIEDGRLLSADVQQKKRNQAIQGFKKNLPMKKISQMTGISVSRLYALKKQYELGDNNLTIKKRGKSAGDKKITDKLDNNIIENLTLTKRIFDKNTLQAMIEEELCTKLSISTINNYLKQKQVYLNNNLQSPIGDLTIKQWIEYFFSDFISEARKTDAVVCMTDFFIKQEIQTNVYLSKIIIYPHTKFMFSLDHTINIIDDFLDHLSILISQFDKKIFLIAYGLDLENLNDEEKSEILTFLQKNCTLIKLFNQKSLKKTQNKLNS
jgi:hypothetical protein